MAPIVGYWKEYRGNGDPIYFLLAYKEIAYEPKYYNVGSAPDYKVSFRSVANELGLDFPNLPYYMDGEVKLSQTVAILRYLGRKHDLIPADENETMRCDVAEQALMEMWDFMFRCWRTYTEEDQKEISNTLPAKLEQLNKFLGVGPYILGEKLSYPDFIMYSLLDFVRIYKAEFLENLSNLKDFMVKFEALPKIDSYIKSDKFSRLPVTGIFYGWYAKAEAPETSEIVETPETKETPETPTSPEEPK